MKPPTDKKGAHEGTLLNEITVVISMTKPPSKDITISSKTGFIIIGVIAIPLLAIVAFAALSPQTAQLWAYQLGYGRESSNSAKSCEPSNYKMYSGTQLYLDSSCSKEFAVVLGHNRNHVFSNGEKARGLKLRYPDGSEEWKLYDAMGAKTYVKAGSTPGELKELEF